jgi:hypothetical protein
MSNVFEVLSGHGISVEENESGQWMFSRGTETDEVLYDDCFSCAEAALSYFGFDEEEEEWEPEEYDQFRDDVEADADALAQIGWGTDEDYGYYGDE